MEGNTGNISYVGEYHVLTLKGNVSGERWAALMKDIDKFTKENKISYEPGKGELGPENWETNMFFKDENEANAVKRFCANWFLD